MSTRPELQAAQYWAVIAAAGMGSRVGAELPKQYLKLLGRTLLEHALEPFLNARWISGVVVVLSPTDQHFKSLAIAGNPRLHQAIGGARRADSVLAGLAALAGCHAGSAESVYVLVHDAARPAVRAVDLERLRDVAGDEDGGLLAMPVSDTLKRAEGDRAAATVDRRVLWRAQTPQMFRLDLLRHALERALATDMDVTDEARAMEAAGHRPRLVSSHAANLKVTTTDDLALAEFWLKKTRGESR